MSMHLVTKTSFKLFLCFLAAPLFAQKVVYEEATGKILEVGDGDVSRFVGQPGIKIVEAKEVPRDIEKVFFSSATNKVELRPQKDQTDVDKKRKVEKQVSSAAVLQMRINALDSIIVSGIFTDEVVVEAERQKAVAVAALEKLAAEK